MALRRKRTEDEIVAAAWDLVHEHGLASLSIRDLGERVGMKAQSLYSYFASKNDIYDAMFREGQIAFADSMKDTLTDAARDESITAQLRLAGRRLFDFCTSDPARYQLMFQRVIPDFVPSPEATSSRSRRSTVPASACGRPASIPTVISTCGRG